MTAPQTLGDRLSALVQESRRTDLVLRLSLLALIFNSRENTALFIGAAALTLVAWREPRLYRSPWLWLAAAAAFAARTAIAWEGLDNHVFLTMWWAVALAVSLRLPDSDRALAVNGRLLVGLVFAFATLWKLISGEFLDGSFFHYSLLLDDRFQYLAESIGGLSSEAYRANYETVAGLRTPGGDMTAALLTTERIETLALVLTWWTIAIEAAVAITWLAPQRVLAWPRHASLLLFGFTTYLAVPVGGFGALLMVMALAQCGHSPRARLHWVVAFAVLLVWAPLWRALFY